MENINPKLLAGAPGGGTEIKNPIFGSALQNVYSSGPTNFLSTFLPRFIGFAFIVGSVLFLFMFVTGAIQWIASGGDKQGLESAKGRITSAIIGIILLFASYAIINLIEGFFGVNILTIDIGPLVIQ